MITALPCRQAKQSIYQMLGELPFPEEDKELSMVRNDVENNISVAATAKERYEDAKARVKQARIDKKDKDTINRLIKCRNNRASDYNGALSRSQRKCESYLGRWVLLVTRYYDKYYKAKTPEELQTVINELFSKKVY